jgi:hypothetical protein
MFIVKEYLSLKRGIIMASPRPTSQSESSSPTNSSPTKSEASILSLKSLAESADHNMRALTYSDVSNVRVSANTAGMFLFIAGISSLSDCGSVTTYISLGSGICCSLMAIHQNGWEETNNLAAQAASSLVCGIGEGLNNTKKSLSEYDWKGKWKSASETASSYLPINIYSNVASFYHRVKNPLEAQTQPAYSSSFRMGKKLD